MATKLEICNAALTRLGVQPMSSLSDTSKEAALCNAHYARIKSELLVNHPWKFALIRTTLSPTGTTPEFEFSNQFNLPSDYLRIFRVYPDYIGYKTEGTTILCDETSFQMIYIADAAESDFRTYFTEVLISKLALELSYSLIQSNDLTALIREEYKEKLRDARLYNAQEGTPYELVAEDYLNVRY